MSSGERTALERLSYLALLMLLAVSMPFNAADAGNPDTRTADSPQPFIINSGLNDAWYDPATPGQGFLFTVLPQSRFFFLSWFTFDTELPAGTATATLGNASHRWLTAYGAYEPGNTVTLEIELTTGGQFELPLPGSASAEPYGTITLRIDSCHEAELSYEIPSLNRIGTIELVRIVDDNVPLCRKLSSDLLFSQPRNRPRIDRSLGYNIILSDLNTPLRGASLSLDGGDPYGSTVPVLPSQASLNSLATDYGLNLLHVYLEADAQENPNPVGVNLALADALVERTAAAGLYLMITIGNNGENGAIHSMQKTLDFWSLYAARYADETHVLFEAHNEPVMGQNGHYSDEDWDRQVRMYKHIRNLAPDSMIFLGSFMSFFGAPAAMYGADYIRQNSGDQKIWDNAAFAFHGYWDLAGIESTMIEFEQAGLDYPALLCTEFWPGDTEKGYNAAFESHHVGWAQFQWLNAQDLDLDNMKHKLDMAGTVWRPERPQSNWPSAGQFDLPAFGNRIGIYSHHRGQFVSFDGSYLRAGSNVYTESANDSFTLVDAGNGFVALQTEAGKYLSANGVDSPLTVSTDQIGASEMWEWMALCPEQEISVFTLRPWGGGGHLIGELDAGADQGRLAANADDASFDGAAVYGYVTAATEVAPPRCEAPPPHPPGPFYGSPMSIPTDASKPHPYNGAAPANVIYASDFDHGGEGVAYHDADEENRGDMYRWDVGVDIELFKSFTNVGWIEPGEWLKYSVRVETAGDYVLRVRVSSAVDHGEFHLEIDDIDITGPVFTPNTGAWNVYRDMEMEVALPAGAHELNLVSAGGFNVVSFDFRKVTAE